MAVKQRTIGKPDEVTPLLPTTTPKYGISVLYRALLCGFMISLSFGVTQVPLIYVFRLMTCETYYSLHPSPTPENCNIPSIQASTAHAVALLGASTTFFGVLNLFLTTYTIRHFGIKSALLSAVFWPAVRLGIQNVGVRVGGQNGITIIQCSQIITVLGGPAGYILALNSYVAEIVSGEERTGALGRLQGFTFFGTAMAYMCGGWIGEVWGIELPFRVTVVLFLGCCVFVCLGLPSLARGVVDGKTEEGEGEEVGEKKGIVKLLGPLAMFKPQKWMAAGSGKTYMEYGVLLLGIGVFLGVLSTGYQSVLLQMYATDVFEFGTTQNGYLISLNTFVQGVFLTSVFPRTIAYGRAWLQRRKSDMQAEEIVSQTTTLPPSSATTNELPITTGQPTLSPANQSPTQQTFAFDLLYCRYSLLVDSCITASAALLTKSWQMYLIAAILPFASGTGAAAKGSMVQMCRAEERVEALGAVTLVEMLARLMTTTVFGYIFAAFAEVGMIYMVFICNATVALLGFITLLFARFPLSGSQRAD